MWGGVEGVVGGLACGQGGEGGVENS